MQITLPPGQRYIKRFIIYAEFGIPEFDLNNYRLKISGEVEKPLELKYDDILKMPRKKIIADFHCVTGWSVNQVNWEGIPFKYILEIVKPKSNVNWAMFYCLDGYTSIVPYQDLMADDAILALKINGEPLSIEQGFPIRPFIPHLYGWKSAKWLKEIKFLEDYVDGYWEERGYHERGNVWEEERFKGEGYKHSRRRPVRVNY